MNTKKLHTLFLRLTIALCALFAAGLKGYAEDPSLKDLKPITDYHYVTAYDLGIESKSTKPADKSLKDDSLFFVVKCQGSQEYSATIELKNGETVGEPEVKDGKALAFQTKNANDGVAFTLPNKMKCKVIVHGYNGGGDEGTSREMALRYNQGLITNQTFSDDYSQYCKILKNNYVVCEFDAVGNVTTTTDSEGNTVETRDYFFITGNGNQVNIFAIEIIPCLNDSWIWYNGDKNTSLNYNVSNIGITMNDPSTTYNVGFDTSKAELGGYLVPDHNWNETYKVKCNWTADITNEYGNNKELWVREEGKELDWNCEPKHSTIALNYAFFLNMSYTSGDKITVYGKITDGYTSSTISNMTFIEDGWDSARDNDTNPYKSDSNPTESNGLYSWTLTIPDQSYLTSMQSNGLSINANGITVTKICYEPASSDINFTVDNSGIINPTKARFSNELSGVTSYLEEGIHAVTIEDNVKAAYYFYITDFSTTVTVTSTLSGVLTLSLTPDGFLDNYEGVVVYRGDVSALPSPYVTFNFSPVKATIAYEYTKVRDLESSYPTWNPTIQTEYSPTGTWTWSTTDNDYTGTNTFTLSGAPITYKNTLYTVKVTASYECDSKTYTSAVTYPLVILCPHYTFAKIGSDAKLITGCASANTEYSDSNPDSTSSDWAGWNGDDNVKPSLYDDLGAYYQSAAWPICYSCCMHDEMYKYYYRIDYHIFAEYPTSSGTETRHAYATSSGYTDNSGYSVKNKTNGSMGNDVKINIRGGNGLNKDYIYDGIEIRCANDQKRTLPLNNTIYLETKIYATSDAEHNVEDAGTLVGKGLYKFILFQPPYIAEDEEDNAGRDGIIADNNTAITIKSSYYSTATDSKYLATGYTTDASLPMNQAAENITFITNFDSNSKYEVASTDSNKPFPGHTTVYFITDFVTPDYYFYTGEGGTNDKSKELAVLSRKFMFLKETTTPYSVQYDTELYKKDDSDNFVYDSDGKHTFNTTTIFKPTDEALNNRINEKLQNNNGQKLHVMLGTQNVLIYNSSNAQFQLGGVQWKVDPNGGFDEYIDDLEQPLGGQTWEPAAGTTVWDPSSSVAGVGDSYSADKYKDKEPNPNPCTECNYSLGNTYTENGGMFLTPMSGDFVRLEPEYDGVITLWIRQNGATDNSTRRTGYMARRPTYIMDENGEIMERSTYKPTVESYFCVDGSYAAITGRNTFRRDFEETWRYGLLNWNSTSFSSTSNVSGSKPVYRLYSKWFSSVNLVEKNITPGSDKNGKTIESSDIDFTKSQYVDRYDKMSPIIYRSQYMIDNIEKDKDVLINYDPFAKYGYELPNFSYVRYRIPVKAGKSYYVGGRGTKNGFVGVRFDEMPANYTPADYAKVENFVLNYGKDTGEEDDQYYKNPNLSGKDREDLTDILDSYDSSITDSSYKTYAINAGTAETELPYSDLADGTTIDVVLNREFTAGYWHPIVLPFSVSETRMKEIFGEDVAVLYLDPYYNALNGDSERKNKDGDRQFTSVINPAILNDYVLKFTRHYYQMLYANTPAFICPSGFGKDAKGNDITSVSSVTFKRVTFQKTNKADGTKYTVDSSTKGVTVTGYQISPEFSFSNGLKGYYEIKGTYTETTLGNASDNTDHGIYYMSNSGTANGGTNKASIYHLSENATVTMRPTRVWIEWKQTKAPTTGNSLPPRLASVGYQSYEGYELEEAPDTNAIYDIIADEVVIPGYDDDTVYDMMGRIVAKGGTQGLAPGFYIYQGRKVAVK